MFPLLNALKSQLHCLSCYLCTLSGTMHKSELDITVLRTIFNTEELELPTDLKKKSFLSSPFSLY